ncbi:MAG: type IX secretion system protein PorQ [Bacteroidales bacterium]|nr:type IX secretion system protein PorQ [Bacteroidales bacterium]
MKQFLVIFIFVPFFLNAQIGGTSTYKFLDLTNSARIAALGGANVSIKDPNLIFNNPALMDSSTANQFNVSYVNYFAGISWGYSSYTFNPSKLGFFAVGIQYVDYGKFIATDEFGNITGEFEASDYVLSAAWAYNLDSFFTVGVVLKPIISSYEIYNSFGIAADIGMTYFSRNKNFSAGLVFRNIGTQIKPYVEDNYEPLPFDIQVGISQKLAHAPFRFSVVAHHLNKPNLGYVIEEVGDNLQFNETQSKSKLAEYSDLFARHFIISTELVPSENFYISFGFNYQRRQELKIATKTGLTGFSAGVGIKIKKFAFNYGIAKYHLAGSSHTFTMALNINQLFKR